MKFYIFIGIRLIFFISCLDAAFRQERAKIKYWNPKYVKDVSIFTGRRNRHESYLTNLTGTTLVPFGNNVSFTITLDPKLGTSGELRLTFKLCDVLSMHWAQEFAKLHFDGEVRCPFPPQNVKLVNMVLPPRKLPVPIPPGDYNEGMKMFVTQTKELIVDTEMVLHFEKLRA